MSRRRTSAWYTKHNATTPAPASASAERAPLPRTQFLITLARASERHHTALTRLASVGVTAPRIHWAVDGSRGFLGSDSNLAHPEGTLHPGEAATTLSHWQVAATMLREDIDEALVFEDDATPLPGTTPEALRAALHDLPRPFHFAYLSDRYPQQAVSHSRGHTPHWRRLHRPPNVLCAYAISRHGARWLYQTAVPVRAQIDEHLRQHADGLDLYRHHTGLFTEDFQWGSSSRPQSGAGKIPQTIHQVWLGEQPLGEKRERWAATWRYHNPAFSYRLWRDADVEAEFGTHPALALVRHLPPAVRADVARILILHRHGGLYVDTDFEALAPLGALLRPAGFAYGKAWEKDAEKWVENGFLASVPGHPCISLMERTVEASIRDHLPLLRENFVQGVLHATGPHFLQSCVRGTAGADPERRPYTFRGRPAGTAFADSGIVEIEPELIYPVWVDAMHKWHPNRFPHAIAVHHYETSWNTTGRPAGYHAVPA